MKQSLIAIVLMATFAGRAYSQNMRTYTSNEEDSIACITALSLYIEFFKQENYPDAIRGWRDAVRLCPKSTESLWINGIKIYQHFIENEEDKAKKNLLIDTLEWAYDQRIEHFGNEGYVLGRKGSDMVKYRSSKPEAAYKVLAKSHELQGMEMEAGAVLYYFKSAYDMYRRKLADESVVIDLYGPMSAIVNHNKDGKYGSTYEMAQKNIDSMMGKVADCDKLIEIFKPKFDADPTNQDLLDQATNLLDKQNCSDSDFYLELAVAKYALNPNADAAYSIGKAYYKRKKYTESNKYFKEVVESSEDQDQLFESYQFLAVGMLNLGQPQSAKTYALKMIGINPNSGEAYIIIGNAYVKGKSDCGGDECKSRAAYWAAVDKFQKAKAVDADVADKAQQLINSYSAQFPKKEDCFFYGLTEGQSFTLDCWIGETTTVRTRD